MVIESIKDRIIEFLKSENKSSAHFAQEIGVQPSAISHIISGRNKPSLDFVMKMVNTYPFLSADWLLFGKGSMYSDKQKDLFSSIADNENKIRDAATEMKKEHMLSLDPVVSKSSAIRNNEADPILKDKKKAYRIIIFHEDNSFTEYFPGGE